MNGVRLIKWFLIFSAIAFVSSARSGDGLQTGSKAPEFALPQAGSGIIVKSTDFINTKILIVHFWKSK